MPGGNTFKYTDSKELQEVVDNYFVKPTNTRRHYFKKGDTTVSEDDNYEEIPIYTISGLAYGLGFLSRQSIYDYINLKEDDDPVKRELSYIVKRACFFIESEYEAGLRDNNVAGVIFALKNMGWKDKTEIDQRHSFAKMPSITVDGKEVGFDVGT